MPCSVCDRVVMFQAMPKVALAPLIIEYLAQHYPGRTALGLVLMASQAFVYNAIFFTYALVLTKFYGIAADRITPYSAQALVQAYLVKIAPEVGGHPELRPVEARLAEVALVDLVGQVGPAEVRAPVMAMLARGGVSGRLGVEVALAEHWAAAGLDGGGVHRPIGLGRRGGRENDRGAHDQRRQARDQRVTHH